MRISTSMAFETGAAGISKQQYELIKTQQQLASGRRVITASDDPIAAARIVDVASVQTLNQRFLSNQSTARNDISITESNLGQATDILQDIRTLLIQAGDGAYGDRERADIAREIEVRGDELLALANSRDASGRYVFSGFQENSPAFKRTGAGVVFQGDEGRREVQVANGRTVSTSLSGAQVFDRVRTGNGVFTTNAAATNGGAAMIGVGQVANAAALDGHSYSLVFHVAAGVTTYDVLDDTAATTVSSGTPYVSGATIAVAGMQAEMNGPPADGDQFSLAPSGIKNIFDGISDAVQLLRASAGNAAPRARLAMGMADILTHVDRTLDHVSQARTEAGVALGDLDRLESATNGLNTGFEQEMSQLRDLDYTKAVSDLMRQQISVEASQKAFAKVMGRSLFDLI
ncbi:MAG: flagellar hook-associated protein FlgL [Burkholderiales bacterium]